MIKTFLAAVILLTATLPATADVEESEHLTISHPWSRATAPNQKVGAVFMEISTKDGKADRTELILHGSFGAIVVVLAKTVAGIVVLCFGVSGFLCDRLGAGERVLAVVAGSALVAAPFDTPVGLAVLAGGIALTGMLFVRGRTRARAVA